MIDFKCSMRGQCGGFLNVLSLFRSCDFQPCPQHTCRPIVFIQLCVEDMSIVICAFKVSVD